jgi:predicted lipid-binding transport protein (Tim44 family)
MLKQEQRLIAGLLGLALATAVAAQTNAPAPGAKTVPPAPAAQPAPGAGAKTVTTPAADQSPDVAARIKENEDKLARAAAEEAKRAAVIKAYEDEQEARLKQLAREKEERDARRARAAYEAGCTFKSVMSDEDIARCRAIHRN